MVGAILAVVSYLDDLYELSPKVRLITQSSVAVGGIVALGGLGSLDFGLFSIENQLFTNIIAFVAVIWFINLYNFLGVIEMVKNYQRHIENMHIKDLLKADGRMTRLCCFLWV